MSKDKLKFLLKLVMTLALLAFIILKVDWQESLSIIINISIPYIFLLLLLSLSMITISCIKWQIFLQARNIKVSLFRLVQLYYVGYFFNNFLPSSVGGDVVRSVTLGRKIQNQLDSFSSVFLERFTGFLGLLVLAIIAFMLNFNRFRNLEIGLVLVLLSVAFIGVIAVFFSKRLQKLIDKMLDLKPFKIIKNKAKKFLNVIYFFKSQPIVLTKTMIISFIFHIMTIVNTLVVCLALDIQVAVLDVAVIVPIILIVSTVPISINAIGVWEGSFVYFFSLAGVDPSASLAIALVLRAKNLFNALVGGLFYLFWNELPDKQLSHEINS